MKRWSIYTITNTISGRQYVGISTRPNVRWRQHCCGYSTSKYLHNAIVKNGENNFSFAVIASAATLENAYAVERALIIDLGTRAPVGYNLSEGGEGCSGHTPSAETRAKIGAAAKGRKHSAESVDRMKAALTGRKKSPEHIECHRQALLGRKASPEAKALLASYRHLAHSPEARAKRSAALKGRDTSAWAWKSGLSRRGMKASPEARANMSAAGLGRKQTSEQIAKRVASRMATLHAQGRSR